ncbi:MAG: hypothetical protein NDI62_03020 [Burkholderiales bacterium]|nr:hypothetical protein [Burkholderiales bacterium]
MITSTIAEVTQKEMIFNFPSSRCGKKADGCFVYNKLILTNSVFVKVKKGECSCSLSIDKQEYNHYSKVQN